MTPPAWDMDVLTFDFDKVMQRIEQTGAMNDVIWTYMNTYAARGGKLLIFQGVSDPVFSAHDIQNWYKAVSRDTNGGDAKQQAQWARLFMVPGMTHCGGGPALDNFDPLSAIQSWVEKDQAPESLPASGTAFPGKHQPLCAIRKPLFIPAATPIACNPISVNSAG